MSKTKRVYRKRAAAGPRTDTPPVVWPADGISAPGIGGDDQANIDQASGVIREAFDDREPIAATSQRQANRTEPVQTVGLAAPAAAPVEPPEPALTRRSRTASGDNNFDVPNEFKKPGWDYEWKTIRVVGADVDGYELASYHEQGWRPVKGAEMPKMLAPGDRASTIDRLGQRLMTRPQHLTDQARAEDYQIAETQKLDKLKAASAIPIAGSAAGKMHGQVDHFEIENVVGTTGPKAA